MDEKMFCNIMNRIRKITKQQGDKPEDIAIQINLVNGGAIQTMLSDYELLDGYIEIYSRNDTYCYVPINNIVSINV